MLQQTQTGRVAEKFPQFIQVFPDFKTLAESSLHQVLNMWNGLGYNRRGRFLYEAAQKIMSENEGHLPSSVEALDVLPGIGINTAGSILAFARNEPTIFLETNIKAVLIFYFFPEQEEVHDRQLLALLPELLDKENSRKWYYALMDHGVWLKKEYGNPTRKSSSYKKQSPFEGSVRQVRGAMIRFLLAEKESTEQKLFMALSYEKELCEKALAQLIAEKLIQNDGHYLKIS
jgi:A/G-specific adenine glycosylase